MVVFAKISRSQSAVSKIWYKYECKRNGAAKKKENILVDHKRHQNVRKKNLKAIFLENKKNVQQNK